MDVFLDYHGVDVDEARRLAAALRAAGREVLFDDSQVVPERGWLRAVGDAGLRAPFLFLMLSPRTPKEWIRSHTGLALCQQAWAERDERPFTLVPVLTGGMKLDPEEYPVLYRWTAANLPVDPSMLTQAASDLGSKLEHWGTSAPLDRIAVQQFLTSGPFPGLRAFNANRATLFMGRDAAIRECLQRIDSGARWLQIEGASGVGKTSLVRAGLLVAMQVAGQSPFGSAWRHCVVRPGGDPVYDLALALHKALDIDPRELPPEELAKQLFEDDGALTKLVEEDMPRMGHRGLMLVLDQLDDGFTQQPLYPDAFVPFDRLIAKTLDTASSFRLTTTVRSDRLDGFRTMPLLEQHLNRAETARYHLPPLRDDDLRAVIVDPIHLVGASIGEPLTEELIRLAQTETSYLPKLAVVLRALWRDAAARDAMHPELSIGDFAPLLTGQARPAESLEEPFEGLRNAFSNVLDQSVAGLSQAELEAARDMLIAVVRPGRAGTPDLRCLRERGFVVHATDHLETKQARKVLRQLAGPVENRNPTGLEPFRVIESLGASGDSESLDIRHDVLLTEWRLLAVWLEESRDFLERRDELMLLEAKPDPFESGPPPEAIVVRLTGEDLDETTQLRYLGSLDRRTRTFLDDIKKQRPAPPTPRRVSRALAVVAMLALVAVGGSAWWALTYRLQAADDTRMAAVKVAALQDANHAARVLLAGIKKPEQQERWADEVIESLKRPAVKRALVGANSELIDLDVSPDAARVAAGYGDGTLVWWDVDTNAPANRIQAHDVAIRSVAFSADGQVIVTASHDQTARIFAVDGSAPPITLEGHDKPLTTAAVSPDSQRIFTASQDNTARVWRRDGRLEYELTGHRQWVSGLEVSRDGTKLVTTSKDGTARVWTLPGLDDPASAVRSVVLPHEGGWVKPAHFDPTGSQVLTGTANGALRIWTLYEEEPPLARILGKHPGGLDAAMYSADGTRVVSTGRDRTVRVWRLDTAPGEQPRPATLTIDVAPGVARFAPDGRDVVFAVEGGQVWRWTPGEEAVSDVYGSGNTTVTDIVFRSAAEQMITGTQDGVARVWDLSQGRVPYAVTPETPVAGAWFPQQGHDRLFASLVGGGVRVFDRAAGAFTETVIDGILDGAGVSPTGDQVATIQAGVARVWTVDGSIGPKTVRGDVPVERIAYSPDGETLATLDEEGVLRLYGARALPERGTVRLRRGERVTAFGFAPEGNRVVVGGTAGTVTVWAIPPRDVPDKTFTFDGGKVYAVTMTEEGLVVAGGEGGTAQVWSLSDPELAVTFADHGGPVLDVAITADGEYVLTRADDRIARLWKVAEPDEVVRRSEPTCSAVQAVLLPDGRVAVACGNGPAEMWKATGHAMHLSGVGRTVAQVAFSADGTELITTSDEGPFAIWPASQDRLRDALLTQAEPCLTPTERVNFLEEDLVTAEARWRGCQLACWGVEFGDDVEVARFRCPRLPEE